VYVCLYVYTMKWDVKLNMTVTSFVFCFRLLILSVMRTICSTRKQQCENCTHCQKTQNAARNLYATIGLWIEGENQQDATVRCLLSTLNQNVSGIIMTIFRRTKTVCYCTWCAALVLLDVVGLHSAHTLQRSAPQPLPTTSSRTSAAHHMQ